MVVGHGFADAFLALGANLGSRLDNLRAAVQELGERGDIEFLVCSSVYETDAVGGPPGQPNFLNAVVKVRTSLSPEELLARCQEVEARLGRCRSVPNAAREIDVDVLLYAEQVIRSPALEIPHPRLHLRRFVLDPLVEIAPDVCHPLRGVTMVALRAALPEERVTRCVLFANQSWACGA